MKENETQDKQSIKSQRVKNYFIQATKKIICDEGIEGVSIRKVAEQAGYAFPTIYNYFKDQKDLLYEVKLSMIQDIIDHMEDILPNKLYDLQDIKTINLGYMRYFVARPHIFRFLYSYRLHPVNGDPIEIPDFSSVYLETYQSFVNTGVLNASEIATVAKTIIYTIHGLLALYFSDNGMTEEMLNNEVDEVIDYLLKSR